jgi:phenylacetate-coenzyme A ligase PaaK-like adenylate-forming protein
LDTFKSFESQLYAANDSSFEDIALQLFRFQAENNAVYKTFLQNLGVKSDKIRSLYAIPFMPVSFFKHHVIKSASWTAETVFESSSTTGSTPSCHHIKNIRFYLEHAEKCFEYFFGKITDYNFLALLPSYLERKNSSLVAMLDYFIRRSGSSHSGFYLHNIPTLVSDLEKLKQNGKKTILWGVTFALLDIAETISPDLSHCLIFETGGMKGRRMEITRQELHKTLKKGLNTSIIYSEYGMTELMSQAYTRGGERFFCPPWMKIIGRDIFDPLEKGLQNQTAGINIIDLANRHSAAFIETEDLGRVFEDNSFEILGRLDNSDVRGCNLMVG